MPKTAQEQIAAAKLAHRRRHDALQMRDDKGMSLVAIGKVLGVTRQRVEQMIKQARDERDSEPA